jgi:nucleoside-diphosphate-sugar epimerase
MFGFTGRYVVEALRAAGHEVLDPGIGFDLRNEEALTRAVAGAQFDHLIHLAAISFVGSANATDFYAVNTIGTANLLDAVLRAGRPMRKIVVASSANVYGNAVVSPIGESVAPMPINHYACSKLAMEHIVRTYADRLPVVLTRPFNYTGPGQAPHFLVPKLVAHIARRASRISLGNLDVVRDFSDVRAVAQCYVRLLAEGKPGETYNICSGTGRSLRWVMDTLVELSGHQLGIDVDQALVRASEVHRLVGDGSKLRTLIGGTGYDDFRETLAWMLEEAVAELPRS